MPAKNLDLHGMAPDKSAVALLLIDLINDLNFEGSEELIQETQRIARKIARLKRQAHRLAIPCIYVNDNFGLWRSDFHKQVEHCLDDTPGKPVVKLLKPGKDDYFVLKPKHSGFYSTTLGTLLDYLQVKTLILVGIAGNICVLFTANDAYMRDFNLFVPRDCVASNTQDENEHALQIMKDVLKTDIRPSEEIDLKKLAGKTSRARKSHAR